MLSMGFKNDPFYFQMIMNKIVVFLGVFLSNKVYNLWPCSMIHVLLS